MPDEDVGAIPAADDTADTAAFMQWDEEFWGESETEGDALRDPSGLLIEGQIATLEGHYENGKTAVMIDVARQWIEAGRPVLYLDYEMGRRRVRKRMKANKWTVKHLTHWHYLYMPNPEPGLLQKLLALLPTKPLVAVDSYSQAMMYLAREENSATEAGNWWVTELQGARENGATVVVIDQVKQSATSRDRYAGRGTGAKSFGTDVKWFVERYEKFSPTQIGLVKLTLHKDREGVLPEQLAFKVGDGAGHLTLSPTEPPKGDPVDSNLLDEVLDALRLAGWQTAEGIKSKIGHGHAAISGALKYLETGGKVQSRPRSGKGTGVEFAVARDIDDAPSLD